MDFYRETAFQFWWFGCIGALNTLLDLGLFNWLSRHGFSARPVLASLCSTSAGMAFGFLMNYSFVFQPERADLLPRSFRFLLVTMFSCYVIQSAVIFLMTQYRPLPARRAALLTARITVKIGLDNGMIERNIAKGAAVLAGLIWNFLWYKFYVFSG